jgi:hypothetical protein
VKIFDSLYSKQGASANVKICCAALVFVLGGRAEYRSRVEMGENDDMAANPPGPDDDDTKDDAGMTAASDDFAPPDQGEREDDPNLAGLSAQLRGLYKGLLDEPIPDRFMQLLKELESKESETK